MRVKVMKVKVIDIGIAFAEDDDYARKYLKMGKIYTVEKTEVHSWHTNYFLIEIPGKGFNSIHFKLEGRK